MAQARSNQRHRTRKDLLHAASRLMQQGLSPSLEEVAAEAMVSRATAYRYFPSVEALVVEAAVDVEFPDMKTIFDGAEDTPSSRLTYADLAVDAMIRENEAALRTMLAHHVQPAKGNGADRGVARQNRRSDLIEAALAPFSDQFDPQAFGKMKHALALVIGTEAMVVLKDVLELDEVEATGVRHWAIDALLEAARLPSR